MFNVFQDSNKSLNWDQCMMIIDADFALVYLTNYKGETF